MTDRQIHRAGPITPRRFERFVAIGDSQTEGLHDYYEDAALRGWADRFAVLLAATNPSLTYANLAVRGKRTREIFSTQIPAALALDPDLVSVMAGVNDMVRPKADPGAVAADLGQIFASLKQPGRVILSCTFPLPRTGLTKRVTPRLRALNAQLRITANRHGVHLVDLENEAVASDPRLWSHDRIHLNPLGHERLARAFLALLDPGAQQDWNAPLPSPRPAFPGEPALSEIAWLGRYLLPKLGRMLLGRSSGDGRTAKRPRLRPADQR